MADADSADSPGLFPLIDLPKMLGLPGLGDALLAQSKMHYTPGMSPQELMAQNPGWMDNPILGMMGPGSIRGWHGTPHLFPAEPGAPLGQFRNAAIGSGEGAQAYGWGHYVAGNPAVADQYRQQLSGPGGWKGRIASLDDKPIYDGTIGFTEHAKDLSQHIRDAMSLVVSEGGINNATSALLDQIKKPLHIEKFPDIVESGKKALNWLDQNADRIKYTDPSGGHLLEVHIRPDEEELLPWDTPVPREMMDKLEPTVEHAIYGFHGSNAPTGQQVYQGLVRHFKGMIDRNLGGSDTYGMAQRASSQYLEKAGIPGLRYLDAGSRASGEGTHNYVLFDPRHLKIVGRNGERLEPVDHDPFAPEGP